MTVYVLVATTSIAGTLGLFALSYFWQRREERRHLWFAVAMLLTCTFCLSRIAQMLGVWADRPWLPARMLLASALLGGWSTAEFAAVYAGYRASKWERNAAAGLVAVPVGLLLGTELILTQTPIVRTLSGGETFVGVRLGPLYSLFSLSSTSLWALGCVRLARGHVLRTRGGKYFFAAFSAGIVGHLVDVTCTVFHVPAPRLSDYANMPVAIAFALAEVNRYASLFGELEEKVRERTKDLASANEELSRKHAEREALQRRLSEAERFEALGQLAGGVAHDFNNLLTVVVGGTALIKLTAGHIPEVAEHCASIENASGRGTALVRRLLTFARRQPSAPKALDLEAQARNLLPLLEPLVGKQVQVRLETDGPAPVLMDPTRFDQVLMNLVVNARAAMPDGGRVTIRIATKGATRPAAAATEPADEQRAVLVTVTDTGHGIPEDVLPRIFEPFFTTKGEHGTGLGLATVLRATREAGGTVSVDSQAGAGTTFRLELPMRAG